MAKLSEIFSGSDSKSRIFIVLGTIVAIVGVVYVGSKMMGSSKTAGAAKVASAPSLQSVPGGNVTPEYYRALMKANEQSAKQAEITGTSAVPTLVNAPTEAQQTTTTSTSNNCVVACPGTEASVDDDVNAMVRDGKLAAADANQLMALARNNVPVSEYADYLTNLVKQGKLTPEQARKLLEDYTRQHATANTAPSAQLMDGFIRSGKMSLDAANELLALQKRNVSPAEYQAALDKLVREGKLSPDAAAQLMAQYNHQLNQAAAKEGENQLRQMVRSGQITPDVADDLLALQKRNATPAEYEAELNRLVAQGKLTPATAAKLLAQYKAQNAGATGAALSTTNPAAELADMVQTGEVPADAADDLLALQKSNAPVGDYKAELDKLVAAGKISPETAAKLLQQYSDAHGGVGPAGTLNSLVSAAQAQTASDVASLVAAGKLPPDVAAQLTALQKQNVSPEEYAAALDALVRAGKISPEVAQQLKDNYNKNSLAGLVATGKISSDVAAQLADLQNKNVTPEAYNNAIDALVRAGKLSPEMAAQLKNDYNTNSLAGLVKAGKLSPEAATQIAALQSQNLSPDEYNQAIDAMVKAGKISPEVAQQLKDNYGKNLVNQMVSSGQLTPEAARQLLALQKQNASPQAYANAIDALVKAGKLSPEAAQRLKDNYAKMAGLRGEAARLNELQANNVPVDVYRAELMRAVRQHLIDPATAAKLLQQYQALIAPPPVIPTAPGAGVNPAFNPNAPGADNFAVLQQRIAAEQANRPVSTAPAVAGENEEAQFAQEEAAAEAEALKERQQKVQEIMGLMNGQAQALVAAWTPPHMEHKGGSSNEKKAGAGGTEGGLTPAQNNAKNANGKAEASDKPPLLKAGTILFAVLTTAVDSDYPDTPVMATIVSGEFKGAILLGKLALANGMDKVSLNFTMMNRDDWTKTKTVTAFAIDPDTARTVMASSVDKHYWLRYGTLFASSFVSGYANGISQSGSTTTSGIFGTSSVHPELSPGEKFAVGLGQVGSAFGTALQSYVNTPTTVRVNSGVGLGILFMADVTS